MKVEGVVDSTYNKMVNTRNGQAPVYHVVVNGDDVNCGFRDPGYEDGEMVSLDVESTNYGLKLKTGGGNKARPSAPRPANTQPSAASNPRPAPQEFPVAKNTKGITIARQNSGGHAAAIVASLVSKGSIKSVEEAEEAFMTLAYAITDFATGHREEKHAAAMMAVEDE